MTRQLASSPAPSLQTPRLAYFARLRARPAAFSGLFWGLPIAFETPIPEPPSMPLAVMQQAIRIAISSALATGNDLRLGAGANY